jgi:hypothetical protein
MSNYLQKRNKYKAKPVVIDKIRFASKKEGNRYRELKLMRAGGEISDLRLQVPYTLKNGSAPLLIRSEGYPNGRQIKYIADFVYIDKSGNEIIEDVKGMRTQIYKIKKAIMESMGYTIFEI